MRRRLPVLIGVLLVGIGAWAVHSTANDEAPQTPSYEDDAPLSSLNPTRGRAARSPETPTQRHAEHNRPDLSTELRPVSLSSASRRPGETEQEHEARLLWLKKFSQFEERARLTPEQRTMVLQALADLQEQAVASRQDLNEAMRDMRLDAPIPSLADMNRALGDDLLARLREFLSPEQVLAFRRKGSLNSYYAYALSRPLDIGSQPPSGDSSQ